jgi:hypothetical protein
VSTITIDGTFSDWTSEDRIDNPSDAVAGYALYGTADSSDYYIGIQSTAATDPVIGAGTTLYLNTDQIMRPAIRHSTASVPITTLPSTPRESRTFTPVPPDRTSSASRHSPTRFRRTAKASKSLYRGAC